MLQSNKKVGSAVLLNCRYCARSDRNDLGRLAGECPADQKKADARKPVDLKPVGVTDTVIATIDVEQEQGIEDRKFRMRKLVVEPGGIVPWHSHADRPAIIYIVEGEIERICQQLRRADPAQGRRGRRRDQGHVSHWWKNSATRRSCCSPPTC